MVNGRAGDGFRMTGDRCQMSANCILLTEHVQEPLAGARRRSCVVVQSTIVSKKSGGNRLRRHARWDCQGNLHQVVPPVWVNLNGVIPASRLIEDLLDRTHIRFDSLRRIKLPEYGQQRSVQSLQGRQPVVEIKARRVLKVVRREHELAPPSVLL
jgi:hypothetical protein